MRPDVMESGTCEREFGCNGGETVIQTGFGRHVEATMARIDKSGEIGQGL